MNVMSVFLIFFPATETMEEFFRIKHVSSYKNDDIFDM